ncbi:MAG TPA: diaminopimelate epimerase [Candidatus Marinimicrobia bacterium]|nr:diaminopimelate epimerase [Candidatus Neomarinimicrobiota bacterium]
MHFSKYHGLGNDYIVIGGEIPEEKFTTEFAQRVCDRHYGVGSDGVLHGPLSSENADFRLRLYNPDGSEFEKSGNGLRIFTRYLFDKKYIVYDPVTIETPGGIVTASVLPGKKDVRIDMGKASLESDRIPVKGKIRDVLNEKIQIKGRDFRFTAVTVGNPHCVVLMDNPDDLSADFAKKYGPDIEKHPYFPNRTNVQFMSPIDRNNIRIEIWERGAGYTLASGSSSCAAAYTAYRLGLCDSNISVHVPGGIIKIEILKDHTLIMTAPVVKICDGEFSEECFF